MWYCRIMKPSIEKLFSRIAGRYDFLNRLMSGGLDIVWRKKLVNEAAPQGGDAVLDIATGTGDVAFAFAKQKKDIQIIGLDISAAMLQRAKQKAEYVPVLNFKTGTYSASTRVEFLQGDALALPFEDRSFDIVTMAFGIRNLPDYDKGLKEMVRVAKKGGRVLILEFSMPQNFFIRLFYRPYLKFVIPFFGGLFSERSAYEYLWRSVEEFAKSVDIVEMMESVELKEVKCTSLTFGIVSLYQGIK